MFDRAQREIRACLGAVAVLLLGSLVPAMAGTEDLPVPKVTIYPGDAIGKELLTMKAFRQVGGRVPVIREIEAAVGKVATRTLMPDRPIPKHHLRDPNVVKQGKRVRIIFSEGPLTISGVAVPLQSGGVGDLISLRNVDSGTVIKGTVHKDGTVRVSGP